MQFNGPILKIFLWKHKSIYYNHKNLRRKKQRIKKTFWFVNIIINSLLLVTHSFSKYFELIPLLRIFYHCAPTTQLWMMFSSPQSATIKVALKGRVVGSASERCGLAATAAVWKEATLDDVTPPRNFQWLTSECKSAHFYMLISSNCFVNIFLFKLNVCIYRLVVSKRLEKVLFQLGCFVPLLSVSTFALLLMLLFAKSFIFSEI